MSPTQPGPEFSRPFATDRLGFTPVTETLRATAEERQRLATRLDLVSLDDLTATLTLARNRDTGVIHLEGRLVADVVQTCVVSLVSFPSHVEDSFDADFTSDPIDTDHEILFDMENEPPEAILGGTIDLGELVAQYLSLALDPYPRAPGAALDSEWAEGDRETRSPFAALKSLRTGS